MKLRKLLFVFVSLLLFVTGMIFGCKDIGSEPQPPLPPPPDSFGVTEGTVYILLSTSKTEVISGGTPPYVVISPSDTTKVKVSVSGSSLIVLAKSVGRDTIVIGDSGTSQLRDTVRAFVYSVSYNAQVQPIFIQNCTFSSCHVQGGLAPFSLQPDTSFGSMVRVDATSGPCRPILRVKPGIADSSALYLRIEGRCGQQMPLGGGGGLNITQRSTIKNWINEGALRN